MESFDVVIIGGGIQGLSTAYHIARSSTLSIAVVEAKDDVGQGSSRRSGSMLMKSRENSAKISLSLHSYERLMNFDREFDQPLRFRRTGFLSLVNRDMSTEYMRQHEVRTSMGVPSRVLRIAEIETLSPGLRLDGIDFGIYCEDDGEIDVSQLVAAYRKNAERLGTTILTNVSATGIRQHFNRVEAVETPSGRIFCGAVVNAAGPHAKEVASWAREQLPIDNRSRSLYFANSTDPNFQDGPMVEDAASEWYFRALGYGSLLIGMGKETMALESDAINERLWPQVRAMCSRRAPSLSLLKPIGGSTGIRSLTPDNLPIVGPSSTTENLFHNCGWGGEGIMHSPAGGMLTAGWVLGSTLAAELDRSPFLPSRFKRE